MHMISPKQLQMQKMTSCSGFELSQMDMETFADLKKGSLQLKQAMNTFKKREKFVWAAAHGLLTNYSLIDKYYITMSNAPLT